MPPPLDKPAQGFEGLPTIFDFERGCHNSPAHCGAQEGGSEVVLQFHGGEELGGILVRGE